MTTSPLTLRCLPSDEWHRLAELPGAGMETLWAQLPQTTRVVVVERDGQIVGCVTGILMLHAEGLWIAPAHRRTVGVWRKLIRGFWSVAEEFGCGGAWAAAISDDMRRVLGQLGAAPLPGDHFVLPKGHKRCPRW